MVRDTHTAGTLARNRRVTKLSTIVTGGKGNLASYLRELKPDYVYLGRDVLDVTDVQSVKKVFEMHEPSVCIHLAANTDVAFCESNHEDAYQTNVVGTANIVDACIEHSTYLVFTSTDYVFDGLKGMYKEEDPPNPINYYGLTKLLAEYEVRRHQDHLIIRGTMKQTEGWKHPRVPNDMFQSLLFYDEYARIMLALVDRHATGIIHIGKERYNVYEVARKRNPRVLPIKRSDITSVALPQDCSLDVSKMKSIIDLEEVLADVPRRI
ncbi:MAG: SDR family oxidoreductase [Candidatus Thorarchaeota archaeon]